MTKVYTIIIHLNEADSFNKNDEEVVFTDVIKLMIKHKAIDQVEIGPFEVDKVGGN